MPTRSNSISQLSSDMETRQLAAESHIGVGGALHRGRGVDEGTPDQKVKQVHPSGPLYEKLFTPRGGPTSWKCAGLTRFHEQIHVPE